MTLYNLWGCPYCEYIGHIDDFHFPQVHSHYLYCPKCKGKFLRKDLEFIQGPKDEIDYDDKDCAAD